jgi:hypothetical protein
MLRSPLSSPLRSPLSSPLAARRGGGSPAFDPATLFASGELGAWFDRQASDTMLAGAFSNNQAASGDAVTLALNKSSPEFFGANVSSLDNFERASTGVNTVLASANGFFRVSFSATGLSATSRVEVQTQTPAQSTGFLSVNGSYSYILQASSGYIRFACSISSGGPVSVSSIQVLPLNRPPSFQSSLSLRPAKQISPPRLVFDGIDDTHLITFSSSLGSNCTIGRSLPGVGAEILTGQTIGTSFNVTTTDSGLVIINRALTTEETAGLTSYLEDAAFFP